MGQAKTVLAVQLCVSLGNSHICVERIGAKCIILSALWHVLQLFAMNLSAAQCVLPGMVI